MLLEVLFLEESFPTYVAFDVLVSFVVLRVARHVALKGRLVVAPPSAHVADVVAGSVLGSHVVEVLLVGDKSPSANFTLGHVLF